jgi:hypothetical protein
MKIRTFLTGILLLFALNHLVAQRIYKFTGDHDNFHQELTTFMGPNLSKEEMEFVSHFANVWDSVYFSTDTKSKVIDIANLFSERRARPQPHFLNFLNLLNNSMIENLDEDDLNIILNGIYNLPSQQGFTLTNLNHFLTRLNLFVSNQTLFSSNSVNWSISGGDFKYEAGDKFQIIFSNTNLIGKLRSDSLVIFRSSGKFFPADAIWTGTGGIVNWEKAGLGQQEVFAELNRYEIVLSRQDFMADSVLFTNKLYFETPIWGTLTERISRLGNPADSEYPRFESYNQDFRINNIYEGINYLGGFSMRGGRLIGSGTDDSYAHLYIHNQDSLLMTLRSHSFVFLPNRAYSSSTSLLVQLGNDSIYHSDLALNYISANEEISLFRTEKAMSQSPYANTFHNLDMNFEQLSWKRGDSIMYFTMPRGSALGRANFESSNFFNKRDYERLQGYDMQHPLVLVRNFKNYFLGENLPVIDFANYARKNVSEIRHLLLELALRGYIFYDFENDVFRIREKMINTLEANRGRIDYDVINFVSNTEAPLENASFNLNTYELRVNGIPRVFISNVQNVNIFPRNNSVILKKDRNFVFDGVVNAGNFTFYGSNFFFDYDEFKITLQNVDSVSIRAETGEVDESGRKMITEVRNRLRNVTGVLNIDQPDNKSGKENYPVFPRFTSTENSAVLFSDESIQKGAYTADKVYFQVAPFAMDSLNTFETKDLRFTGKFVSGGIFPDIDRNLTIQSDFSLGFIYDVPSEGIPVYGGKGRFYESVNVSNSGIIGSGRLTFETTEITGEEFIFYPDSMSVLAKDLQVAQKTTGNQFPFIQSRNNLVQWIPEANAISVRQKDAPFFVHNQNTSLQGKLYITTNGVTGSGNLSFEDARISSNDLSFSATETYTDTADVMLKIPVQSENTFSGKNFKMRFNHSQNRGEFISNEENNRVEFPINRYVGYVEKMEWLPRENLLKLSSGKPQKDQMVSGSYFLSMHPRQDSLSFVSPELSYNYLNNIMDAAGVSYVEVADAFVYPDNGRVVVEAGANMRTLDNSVIVANRNDQLHRFYEANTLITSKSDYNASGHYDFINKTLVPQKLFFEKIEIDKQGQTVATGKILEENEFTLSPSFEYHGEIRLEANKPFLNFKGGTRIVHNCESVPKTWLSFESVINPDSIYIPVAENPVNLNKDRIFSGSFIANDSIHIYPSFVSFRKKFNDQQITNSGEYLYFEEGFNRYLLGSQEKMSNPENPGNLIVFDLNQCLIRSQGKINPDIDLGQLKLEASGSTAHRFNENSLELDALLTIDFFFNEPALQILIKDLDSLPGPQTVFFRSPVNRAKIQEFIGKEKTQLLWSEIEAEGKLISIPSEINRTIVLNNLQLQWDQESRSYQSYGRMEISNIKGIPVHKSVNGFIEISKRRTGDMLDLYIEISPGNWYYFGYTRGQIMAFSTNNAFNQAILSVPLRQRQLSVRSGQTPFTYMIATDTRIAQFFTRYNRILQMREKTPVDQEEIQTEIEEIEGNT